MAEREDDRLATPGRQTGFQLPRLNIDPDGFGKFAEWIARRMGSAGFLIGMSAFIIGWIVFNVALGDRAPDAWPFMALTLILSVQASYSAPLILLAQNRQEDRDRLSLAEDRKVAAQSRDDVDFLAREIAQLRMNVGEVATRDFVRTEIRDQLRDLLEEIEKLQAAQAAEPADDGATPEA